MNDHLAGVAKGYRVNQGNPLPSLPKRLLPNEPREVDSGVQLELTERYLLPMLGDLEAFFLFLRTQADSELQLAKPNKLGKPYPIGQCLEITLAVKQRLRCANVGLCQMPSARRGFLAFNAFRKGGGVTRQVWGDLRGAFFQNAFQVGTLYVDVANDTVTATKPKVEILPFADAQLVPISDFRHFARLASLYWQDRIYPNHVLPELAPVCPLIHVTPNGSVRIAEATQYMVAMAQAKGFRASEEVLRDEPIPAEVFRHMVDYLAGSHAQLAQTPEQGRIAALRACRIQRSKKWHLSRKLANQTINTVMDINKRLADTPIKTTLTICIDNREYDSAMLSEHARCALANLHITEQRIAHIKQQLAIHQTARTAFARALVKALAAPA